jgi:hypothetical protein
MQFRKKPVVIEAIQFDGENGGQIADWMFSNGVESLSGAEGPDPHLIIATLEGDHRADPGDWSSEVWLASSIRASRTSSRRPTTLWGPNEEGPASSYSRACSPLPQIPHGLPQVPQ